MLLTVYPWLRRLLLAITRWVLVSNRRLGATAGLFAVPLVLIAL